MAVPELEALAAIAKALVRSGFTSLDDQAAALGLPRSTVWTIVSGKHKRGRLHANTTKKLLASPSLALQVSRAAGLEHSETVNLNFLDKLRHIPGTGRINRTLIKKAALAWARRR